MSFLKRNEEVETVFGEKEKWEAGMREVRETGSFYKIQFFQGNCMFPPLMQTLPSAFCLKGMGQKVFLTQIFVLKEESLSLFDNFLLSLPLFLQTGIVMSFFDRFEKNNLKQQMTVKELVKTLRVFSTFA